MGSAYYSRRPNVHADRGVCESQQDRRHLGLEGTSDDRVPFFTSIDVDGLAWSARYSS